MRINTIVKRNVKTKFRILDLKFCKPFSFRITTKPYRNFINFNFAYIFGAIVKDSNEKIIIQIDSMLFNKIALAGNKDHNLLKKLYLKYENDIIVIDGDFDDVDKNSYLDLNRELDILCRNPHHIRSTTNIFMTGNF